jgi:hypothetical protein
MSEKPKADPSGTPLEIFAGTAPADAETNKSAEVAILAKLETAAGRVRKLAIFAVAGSILSLCSSGAALWQAWVAQQVLNEQRAEARPDVNPVGVTLSTAEVEGKRYAFLATEWINSGTKPTVGLRKWRGCGYTPKEALRTMQEASATTPLAPGQKQVAGACPLSGQDFMNLSRTGRFYFLTSRIVYNDQVGTPREAKACFAARALPESKERPDGTMTFDFQTMACASLTCKGNVCAGKPGAIMNAEGDDAYANQNAS